MFRILFALLIIYVIWRLWKRSGKKQRVQDNNDKITDSPSEMVECSRCGTFIISNDAIRSRGKIYCSEGCLKGN